MDLPHVTDTTELQDRIFYSVIVAGKSAAFANSVIKRWVEKYSKDCTTFDACRRLIAEGKLEESFRDARTGNYGKLTTAMKQLVESDIDLATCTPQDLEKIKGIGPKTSRFFIMWTRPDAVHAALDVHILRWMRKMGYDVPKSTPQSTKKYAEIEKWFIAEAERMGMTPRELDAIIWDMGSKSINTVDRPSPDTEQEYPNF